ncbi:MAG: nucleoside-diphosphate sugar epimerase [Crocinitomicaceae bacterium]|nr:nucleoside-diphosphate sugar epimerase [Crocinitomicaceae bacterium]MBP6032316.1 nucleoside-diphosphate sugar epimerase [Crocinitomicaceae bacterium]
MDKKVVIIGATGLVGNALLQEVIQAKEVSEIRVFVRKAIDGLPEKVTQIVTDFSDFSLLKEQVIGDVIYCCVGTTRKKTPDLTDYRNIDFGINIGMAKLAKENGIPTVHLISAIGASTSSRIFYSKIKGEIEEAMKELKFDNCYIYQPSILIGSRTESRPMEYLSQKLCPFLDLFMLGVLKDYHSISATSIAQFMHRNLGQEKAGVHVMRFTQMIK